MSETRNFAVAIGAALGIAGLVTLFVMMVLGAIKLVERRRKPPPDYPITGDGAWPRVTGVSGVEITHPPLDHVHDETDPTTDPEWPGKVKRRRAF